MLIDIGNSSGLAFMSRLTHLLHIYTVHCTTKIAKDLVQQLYNKQRTDHISLKLQSINYKHPKHKHKQFNCQSRHCLTNLLTLICNHKQSIHKIINSLVSDSDI